MSNCPDRLATEFRRERSIRRTVTVLEAKRKRVRDELQQVIQHLALLVPVSAGPEAKEIYAQIVQDAAQRLGDDAFAQLLLQILQESPK
ncbi:MAG: hypothetical protein HC890_08800 [Chloroflexaceae bacterium]|nr:hypothetical protein [Chloroflexaceae bacterium]